MLIKLKLDDPIKLSVIKLNLDDPIKLSVIKKTKTNVRHKVEVTCSIVYVVLKSVNFETLHDVLKLSLKLYEQDKTTSNTLLHPIMCYLHL
jgi:hypothetical protein